MVVSFLSSWELMIGDLGRCVSSGLTRMGVMDVLPNQGITNSPWTRLLFMVLVLPRHSTWLSRLELNERPCR